MKAKLIMEMPNSCSYCFIRRGFDIFFCNAAKENDREIDVDTEIARPDWCPLEPVGEE